MGRRRNPIPCDMTQYLPVRNIRPARDIGKLPKQLQNQGQSYREWHNLSDANWSLRENGWRLLFWPGELEGMEQLAPERCHEGWIKFSEVAMGRRAQPKQRTEEESPSRQILKETCTDYTRALFVTASIWKQSACPGTGGWTDKLWYLGHFQQRKWLK